MDEREIQDRMIEHKNCNVTRSETEYRWDFGIHHVAEKYNSTMGDEAKWLAHTRARAAAMIARMTERR